MPRIRTSAASRVMPGADRSRRVHEEKRAPLLKPIPTPARRSSSRRDRLAPEVPEAKPAKSARPIRAARAARLRRPPGGPPWDRTRVARLSGRLRAHAPATRTLRGPGQMRGHFLLHLALEPLPEQQRAQPESASGQHGRLMSPQVMRRMAVSAPEKAPPFPLIGQMLSPRSGQRVDLGAAAVVGLVPRGADQTALLQPVQRRIERAGVDVEYVPARGLDPQRQVVAVGGFCLQQLQDD